MWIGCCELAKLNMEQLFCAIIRSCRATVIARLASRLLFFSTIMQRNFWRGGTFLLFSGSPAKLGPLCGKGRLREGAL